jgi:FkbM family methyltransferase
MGAGTFLDIGANMGVISIGMLTGGEFARAIAMEPDPRNFSLLQRNARQNGLDEQRYLCLPYAASDRRGELEFELSGNNFGDHRVRVGSSEGASEKFSESARAVIRIVAQPVDEILDGVPRAMANDIAVVWIDTQGHEGHLLRGGPELFARNIPVVSEVWPYGLARAGTSADEFCKTASRFWSAFCVWRQSHFERHPIAELAALFREITRHDQHENVVFLK